MSDLRGREIPACRSEQPGHQLGHPMMPDLRIENHGSIALVRPTTHEGRVWLEKNSPSGRQFGSGTLLCEPKDIVSIVAAAGRAGLRIAAP